MKNIENMLKNKIFLRYISIILLTAVLPLVLGGIVIATTMKKANVQTVENSYAVLENTQRSLSRELDNIRQYAIDLALDNDIVRFEYRTNNENYAEMINILNKIKLTDTQNKFYVGVYLYFADSRTVLYDGAKYSDRQFYNAVLFDSGESYEEWSHRMRTRHKSSFSYKENEILHIDRRTIPTIQYTQAFPLDNTEPLKGNICILLDYDKLTEYYCGIYQDTNKALYVLNNAGEIIYSIGTDKYQLEDKYRTMPSGKRTETFSSEMIFKTSGSMYTFISIEDMGIAAQGLKRVIFIDVIFIFILLLLGILASIYAAYKMSKPVIKMGSILGGMDDEKETLDLDDINARLEHLAANNETGDEILRIKRDSVKQNLLKLLLSGDGCDIRDVREELRRIGVKFDRNGYVAAIIKMPLHGIHDVKTATMVKYIVSQTTNDSLSSLGTVEIIDDGWKEIVVILNFEQVENADNVIIKAFTKIEEFVSIEMDAEVEINIGGIHGDISGVYNSYMEASECSEYRMYSGTGRILAYSKIKSHEEDRSYVYNAEQENEFIRNVVMGNEKAALSCLDDMILAHKDGSVVVLRCLFFNLLGTMLKILNSGNVDIAEDIDNSYHFDDLFACRNMAELKETITGIVSDVCKNINMHGGNKKQNLKRAMLEFVENNYHDNSMSLERIADEFNLNLTYISHFFKEQIGENFSDYLTKLKIEKAKEFLRDTELTIGEIAIKVGYANSTVLIKNFKKIVGVTPGNFREISKQ